MNKRIALICIGIGLAFSTPAQAEHRLFPTDVLEAGQFEATAAFSYSHYSYDYTVKNWIVPVFGTTTRNTFASSYQLGAGLGKGLELTAMIPYYHQDSVKFEDTSSTIPAYRDYDGLGDFAAGVKYRLYSSKTSPLTMVTGLDVKFETADSDKAGSGTTDITPYLTAGLDLGKVIKPYASYHATIRNHGASDIHRLAVGMQYEINPVITLRPSLSASFITDSDWLKGYESYGAGINCYLQVINNFYLIPSVNYSYNTKTSSLDGGIDYSEINTFSTGLALYYFFN